ncbi:MAG: hypothetical protein ABI550_06755 [Ignavibacteriaceae bacterium]
MRIIKSYYDTIKEQQLKKHVDESKKPQFGIGISKNRCIICGAPRKDVNKEGVCPDCNQQFPVIAKQPIENNKSPVINIEENKMAVDQRIKKQLIDLSVTLNEKFSEIMNDITNSVNQRDIDKIQKIALDGNFIKEIQKTIDKILDEFEDKFEPEQIPSSNDTTTITIDIFNPPSLSFTKIIDSQIENESSKNWSNLIRSALRVAINRGLDLNQLRQITTLALKPELYLEDGYKYDPTISISYQERDANKSFENVVKILKHLSIGFQMRIYWRNREGSQYPGKYGIINWKP